MLINLFTFFFLERSFHKELNVCSSGCKNLQIIGEKLNAKNGNKTVVFIGFYMILLQIYSMWEK